MVFQPCELLAIFYKYFREAIATGWEAWDGMEQAMVTEQLNIRTSALLSHLLHWFDL